MSKKKKPAKRNPKSAKGQSLRDAMAQLLGLAGLGPRPGPGGLPVEQDLGLKLEMLDVARTLHEVDPLAVVPDYRHAISVTVEHFGLRDGLLSIAKPAISEEGEEGWEVRLMKSREDFDAMVAYREDEERWAAEMEKEEAEGKPDDGSWLDRPHPKVPPNLRLGFDPEPSLMFVAKDEDKARTPTFKEADMMIAILLALAEFLKDRTGIAEAWRGGPPCSFRAGMGRGDGTFEVLLGIPGIAEAPRPASLPGPVSTPLPGEKPESAGPKVVEWVGALALMESAPEYDVGAPPSEAILWMDGDGEVAGLHVGKVGEIMDLLQASLDEAIASAGKKRSAAPPQRLRVNAPRLADALRALDTGIEIVCAPTPEADKALDALVNLVWLEKTGKLQAPESARPTSSRQKSSRPDISEEISAYLMQGAAVLFRTNPLAVVPSYRNVISVSIKQLGLHGGLLSISRPTTELLKDNACWTVTLLAGSKQFEAMLAYRRRGKQPLKMPPHMSFTYFPSARLRSAALSGNESLDELAEFASGSMMLLPVFDRSGPPHRQPTESDATRMALILMTLSDFLKDRERLTAAWEGGAPFSRTIGVGLDEKRVIEVELGVP